MSKDSQTTMSNTVIILGLKKAAVVLHELGEKLQGERSRKETWALVCCLNEAIKKLEKA